MKKQAEPYQFVQSNILLFLLKGMKTVRVSKERGFALLGLTPRQYDRVAKPLIRVQIWFELARVISVGIKARL